MIIDDDSPLGRFVTKIITAQKEYDKELRLERQRAGIQKAKLAGKYKGRPKSIDEDEVKRLYNAGWPAKNIAAKLGIGISSVYRIVGV